MIYQSPRNPEARASAMAAVTPAEPVQDNA
jgi:hypothetical protein